MIHTTATFLDGIIIGAGVFFGIGIADWITRKFSEFNTRRRIRKMNQRKEGAE